jgi:hypothetical protein
MTTLHETGISKPRKIIGYILSILPSLVVFLFGLVKFFPNETVLEPLEKLGVAPYAALIGVVEMLCAILYWIPKTSNIGFFLFCSYAGGIIVGELILGEVPVPGLVIAAMIYIGTLLRKPSLSGLGI